MRPLVCALRPVKASKPDREKPPEGTPSNLKAPALSVSTKPFTPPARSSIWALGTGVVPSARVKVPTTIPAERTTTSMVCSPFSGTTVFGDIASAYAAGENMGLLFGLVFVFAGLAFKMSAVPFHMWTPGVYEGAPTPVTTFFARAPKVAAMALSVRVAIEAMGPVTSDWRQIVIFAALASIVLGAVAAIGQQNIKRLLAYSSINNVGFALIGLAAGTAEGVAGVLTYLTIYVVMTLGSFLVVLQMRDAEGQPVETIASLSGLSRTRPALAAALAIFMFSLAGIPPLFGFWAKFAVFEAAVRANLFWLAAIGIAASVIGAFYYLKIVKTMYFDEPAPAYAKSDSALEGGLIAAAAVFVSPLGYLLIPVLGAWSMAAARTLF